MHIRKERIVKLVALILVVFIFATIALASGSSSSSSSSKKSYGAGGYEMPNSNDKSFSDYVKRVDPDFYNSMSDRYNNLK